MIRAIASTFVFLAAACIGCSDSLGTDSALVLERISASDGQSATAGNRLALPLAVRVRREDGAPVGDVRVSWEVKRGAGTVLSSPRTVSDGLGRASVFLTLGPTPDTVVVRASLDDDSDRVVTFTSYAVEPPLLIALGNSTIEGGDTLAIIGSALSDSVVIYFNDQPAQVLDVADSEDTVWVMVPPCLVSGSAEIRARVGSAVSAPLTADHSGSSTPVSIDVGTYVTVGAAQAEDCLLLGGTDSVTYIAAVQSLSLNGMVEDSFLITRGDTAIDYGMPRGEPATDESLQYRFDAHLRSTELRIAERLAGEGHRTPGPVAAPPVPPESGSRMTFRVCNRLDCEAELHFSEVEAEARYVGDYVAVYADLSAPAGGFSEQDYEALGEMFDKGVFPNATRTFGAVSDLDHNGRVNVLLTPVVNGLTSPLGCLYGYVPGFFLPLDLDPAASADPRSNQAEVLYLMVPDPEGAYGCKHSRAQVEETVPVTFVHELQHAISFFQHVIERGGNAEVVWLNEGLSHLAEDLTATHFRSLGDEVRAAQFEMKNLTNASNYLREPGLHSPIFTAGSGTGRERGAAWLFLRWLLDIYGEDMARQLVESSSTGVQNLASATGVAAARLLTEWFMANAAAGVEGLVTHHLRDYSSRDYGAMFLELHQQNPAQFPRRFPLEPLALSANATLSGNLRSGSGEYYSVSDHDPQSAARLRLVPFGEAIDAELIVKIHILRVR